MRQKKWWQFWKAETKSNTLGILIRHSGSFTAYNFAQFVQEAYRQNQQFTLAYNNISARLMLALLLLNVAKKL